MIDENRAVKSRNIRFGLLFAGLTVLTLFFFFFLARFMFLLFPVGDEQVTLQAQPRVAINNQQLTIDKEQGTENEEQSTSNNQQLIINREQGTGNEEQPPTPSSQSPISSPQETNLQSPNPPSPPPPQPPPTAQLLIPSLGVSKTITQVLVEDGQWNIEELESGIGLLQTTGEYPGDDVGMTFVGHVTRPWPEMAGPFADLIFMNPGDEIIYRWDGFDYIYALESFARVEPEEVGSLYVDDGDVITLATCDTWDYVNWTYADRLLARARLVRKVLTPVEENVLQ